jgi:AAA+ ATPase superfamily predicted ATPase
MPTTPFYAREQQLADLDQLTRSSDSAFILVYGRRRVGKTYLLRYWAEQSGLPHFYWMAPRTTAENVRTDLVRELWRWESPEREVESAPRYDNWTDVFRAFRRVAGQRRAIVILDEFPWAVDSDPALPSYLQAAWDSLFRDSQIRLFVLGSHIHTMESLLRSDAPLFGRLTGKLFVPAFKFTEISPFVSRYDLEKQLAVYAMVGGIPDYLRRWDDRVGLMENVRQIFLSDLSPFRNEADILISDVLRRESTDYQAVLSAVAKGNRELNEIARATLIGKDRVASVLGSLIDLRLVEKRIRASVPIKQHEKARYARYYLADPFLRFYYRLVEPNRSYLAQQIYEPVLRNFREQLRPFVAATFEDLCRTWTLEMGRSGRLPFTPEFVGSDWHGGDVQADVVAVNWREAQILIGEAKWGESAIDLSVYKSLQERSQHVLAQMPNARPWSVHLILFARRKFTPPVVAIAKEENTFLVTFEQIVADLSSKPLQAIR